MDVASGEYGDVLAQLVDNVDNGRLIYRDASSANCLGISACAARKGLMNSFGRVCCRCGRWRRRAGADFRRFPGQSRGVAEPRRRLRDAGCRTAAQDLCLHLAGKGDFQMSIFLQQSMDYIDIDSLIRWLWFCDRFFGSYRVEMDQIIEFDDCNLN